MLTVLGAMALRHGNRLYYQVLLDVNRAQLAEDLAAKQGIRTTAWLRNAVYSQMQKELPASVYNEAEALDQATWRRSVRNRVEGRQRSKDGVDSSQQSA